MNRREYLTGRLRELEAEYAKHEAKLGGGLDKMTHRKLDYIDKRYEAVEEQIKKMEEEDA